MKQICILLGLLSSLIPAFAQGNDSFVGDWTGTWSQSNWYDSENDQFLNLTCKIIVRILVEEGCYYVRMKEIATSTSGDIIEYYHPSVIAKKQTEDCLYVVYSDGPVNPLHYGYAPGIACPYSREKRYKKLRIKTKGIIEMTSCCEAYNSQTGKWESFMDDLHFSTPMGSVGKELLLFLNSEEW